MTVDRDAAVLEGARTRYACRSVAEVDSHLLGITRWLAVNLPKLRGSQKRTVQLNYARDIDRLLNARALLASLVTLDDDLAALGCDPVA